MNENNIRLVNSRTATFNLYFKQLIESMKQLQIYLYMDIYGFVYLQKNILRLQKRYQGQQSTIDGND